MNTESATVTPDSAEDERLDACWVSRCATLRNAWVQVRYHRRRQRFFDLVDKLTKALTVVLGASLMGRYFAAALPIVATAITSLGLLALIFAYSDRKQQHKELAEQAAHLVSAIEQVPAGELTPSKVAGWGADYARLCAKAPPQLKTLSLICESEQAVADGHPQHVQLPGFLRRVVANARLTAPDTAHRSNDE
jgi:hypothetical protein